jgi:23S rRNA pseudoU1915 N3-methylase RlmH
MTDQEDRLPVSKAGRCFASESSNHVLDRQVEQALGTVSVLIAMAQCFSPGAEATKWSSMQIGRASMTLPHSLIG